MNTFLYILLVIGYLSLFIWGIFLASDRGFVNLINAILLVIFGLIYDNLIIALGRFIGEGNVLQALSYVRYWLHALFTPTLILFAWNIYFKAGFPWAKKKFLKFTAYTITISLILYELLASIKGLKTEPSWRNGVLIYESVGQSNIPIMINMITLIFIILGLLFMKKFRFPWLLIGTLVIVSGGILTTLFKTFPIMNILEFLFIISLLFTRQYLIKKTLIRLP